MARLDETRLFESIDKRLPRKRPRNKCWPWQGHYTNRGVPELHFRQGDKRYYFKAYRLLYEYFVGPIPQGKTVFRTCGEASCVNPAHIEVGTEKEKMRNLVARGGYSNGREVLNEAQVRSIRASKMNNYALAERYGVTYSAIVDVRNGRTWSHVI